MTKQGKSRLSGAAGGLVNGCFGGGGGMVLLPLLAKWQKLKPKHAFATCVAVMFPACCASTAVYFFQVRPGIGAVVPYLAGGVVGGLIGGLTFGKVPVKLLKILFGLFLLYGGVRYLL